MNVIIICSRSSIQFHLSHGPITSLHLRCIISNIHLSRSLYSCTSAEGATYTKLYDYTFAVFLRCLCLLPSSLSGAQTLFVYCTFIAHSNPQVKQHTIEVHLDLNHGCDQEECLSEAFSNSRWITKSSRYASTQQTLNNAVHVQWHSNSRQTSINISLCMPKMRINHSSVITAVKTSLREQVWTSTSVSRLKNVRYPIRKYTCMPALCQHSPIICCVGIILIGIYIFVCILLFFPIPNWNVIIMCHRSTQTNKFIPIK